MKITGFQGAVLMMLSTPLIAATAAAAHDGYDPNIRQTQMAELDYLVGIWEISSKEVSRGKTYAESEGTRSCVWVLDRTAIRCDDTITRVRATEDFPGLHQPKDRLFYVTYNEIIESYEFMFMNSVSSDKSILPGHFDAHDKSLEFGAPATGISNDEIIKGAIQVLVDENEIKEKLQLVSPADGSIETIETVLHRKTGWQQGDLYF